MNQMRALLVHTPTPHKHTLCITRTQLLTHSRGHAHTYSLTHTISLTHIHTFTRKTCVRETCGNVCVRVPAAPDMRRYTLSHILSLAYTRFCTLFHAYSLSHTHAFPHVCTLSTHQSDYFFLQARRSKYVASRLHKKT